MKKLQGYRRKRWLIFAVLVLLGFFLISGAVLGKNWGQAGNFLKVMALIRAYYLYPVETGKLLEGAVKGMVDSLGDPYSVYLEPDTFSQLQEQIRGTFGGLGILVGIQDEYPAVVKSYEGTHAARAGIEAGDLIVSIDGKDTRGIDLETAVGLMRGPVGTKIKLKIKRAGEPTLREVVLVREEITVPTVEGRVIPGTSIGHVVVSQFNENTPAEMVRVLDDLEEKGVKGLVLDLRDNPGGELHSAVRVADLFLGEGPVVRVDYRVGRDEVFSSDSRKVDLPLVVLVNEHSASASEIVAAAVKDTGSGLLVGTRTFGKGVVQTVFPLGNGAGVKLTTARYLTPKGRDINKKGVIPDVEVKQEPGAGRDRQLEIAVKLLSDSLRR